MEYVESDGGALHNATAGYKTITINLKELSYTVEDYDISGAKVWGSIGLIGEFCGWDNEPLMTRFSVDNSHLWKMDLTLPARHCFFTFYYKLEVPIRQRKCQYRQKV